MSKHQRSMSAVAVRACHCMEACLANCRKMRPPRDVVASQQPPLFRKSKLRKCEINYPLSQRGHARRGSMARVGVTQGR